MWGDDVVPGWKIDGRDLNMNTENECFISQPGSADGVVVATLCTNRCPSTVTVKAQSGVRIDSQTANVTRQGESINRAIPEEVCQHHHVLRVN